MNQFQRGLTAVVAEPWPVGRADFAGGQPALTVEPRPGREHLWGGVAEGTAAVRGAVVLPPNLDNQRCVKTPAAKETFRMR